MSETWPKAGDLVDGGDRGPSRVAHVTGPDGRSAWRVLLVDGRSVTITPSVDLKYWHVCRGGVGTGW
jgi:hypothetical protein